MNSVDLMFSLLRSELLGTDEKIENISEEELEELYNISKNHDLAHIVSSALVKRGMLGSDGVALEFKKQQMLAMYRYVRTDHEIGELYRTFEEAEIPFVPLKGAIVRKYYPAEWMRTSCDIDVLVHEDDVERAIEALKAKGYTSDEERHYHDISLFSENGVHLELHFSIKEHMDNIDGLLSRVWDYCEGVEGTKYYFEQTPEYFVFHHIAHMSYHFIKGGCGIKPFADLYLLMKKAEYNEDTVRAYCAECGLGKFYESAKHLADVWFGNSQSTELSDNMQEFLLTGGVYGTKENAVALYSGKKGGKVRYAISRIFAPYELLSERYPVLEKHKWLMPFMQVRRWGEVLFGGKIKRSVNELKETTKIDNGKAREIKNLFDEIGL